MQYYENYFEVEILNYLLDKTLGVIFEDTDVNLPDSLKLAKTLPWCIFNEWAPY